MKFSAVTACLAASLAPATALSVFNGKAPQVTIDANTKVPGDSPLEFCEPVHDKDVVEIQRVDLAPNPPVPGAELSIFAEGTVKKPIEKGAYLHVIVKYGLIQILSQDFDLCEQIGNVDLECPIKDGKLEVVKKVDIPKEIPPGTYNVQADVYTVNDEPITCLKASVAFGRGFFGGDL